jgi:hypothetical protein
LLLASVRRRALWVRLAMQGASGPFHDDGTISQFTATRSSRARLDAYRAKYGNIQRPDRILGAGGDVPDRYEFTKQAAAAMLSFLS